MTWWGKEGKQKNSEKRILSGNGVLKLARLPSFEWKVLEAIVVVCSMSEPFQKDGRYLVDCFKSYPSTLLECLPFSLVCVCVV